MDRDVRWDVRLNRKKVTDLYFIDITHQFQIVLSAYPLRRVYFKFLSFVHHQHWFPLVSIVHLFHD